MDGKLTELQERLIAFYHGHPFMEYIHIESEPMEDGSVRLTLRVEEEHTNLYGIVHGGVLLTLADTAAGAACLAMNKKVVTVNLSMEFMHSVPMMKKIIAVGRVLHDGRHMMSCESEILDEEGKLYAKSQGTFYVLGKLIEDEE